MTSPDPYADCRRHPRARINNAVTISLATSPNESRCHTANVSESGMFVGSPFPPPIGTMVRFSIDFGAGAGESHPDEIVSGHGHVVWVRLKSKRLDEPCGMGIKFGALTDQGRGLLRFAVANALSQDSLRPPELAAAMAAGG